MFFGAGNFIFPPNLGREAGQNFYVAIMFFCATAVLLPALGVAAIARAKGLQSLVRRIDPVFAVIFTALLYLTIGPLFAIPRAANMPFDIAVKPFIAADNLQIWLFFYSAAYFALNYYVCMNPSKLVDLLGKYLTPLLLALILPIAILPQAFGIIMSFELFQMASNTWVSIQELLDMPVQKRPDEKNKAVIAIVLFCAYQVLMSFISVMSRISEIQKM